MTLFGDRVSHMGCVCPKPINRDQGATAIVPESVIDALRTAEDAEDAAEADAAMDEPGESIPWEQIKAELEL